MTSDISTIPASTVSFADAEGVPDTVSPDGRRWFVALVMHNTEKASAARLDALSRQPEAGIPHVETYVPIQRERRVWQNGRKKMVDRVVCPCYLFVRCTESTRRRIKIQAPFINSFVKDRAMPADEFGLFPFAHIPDDQMQAFMQMVRCADTPVTIDTSSLRIGDKVRVSGGPLRGMEGYLMEEPTGETSLAIRIDILGSARVHVPAGLLEEMG